MRPIHRKLPHAELAFCFPCQPLDSFEWDASAAEGHPEVAAALPGLEAAVAALEKTPAAAARALLDRFSKH